MLTSKRLHAAVMAFCNVCFMVAFLVWYASSESTLSAVLAFLMAILSVYQIIRFVRLSNG